MFKKLGLYTSIIVSVLVIGGYVLQHDQSLARASEVFKIREEIKLIHKRFEEERLTRRSDKVQERVWTLEERYVDKKMPTSVKEEYLRLKVELDKLRYEGY